MSSPDPRGHTILFLCTGNYYRSRFAEILFNHLAPPPWLAESRALDLSRAQFNIGPISPFALKALADRGIAHPAELRFPLPLSESDLLRSHRIIALKEAEHRPMLAARFPGWEDRVEYWHIHDLDQATPAQALAQIDSHLRNLLKSL